MTADNFYWYAGILIFVPWGLLILAPNGRYTDRVAFAAAFVVRSIHRVDFGQSQPGKACEYSGRHPFTTGIDLTRTCRDGDTRPSGENIAVANDYGTSFDGGASVTNYEFTTGNCDCFCMNGSASRQPG